MITRWFAMVCHPKANTWYDLHDFKIPYSSTPKTWSKTQNVVREVSWGLTGVTEGHVTSRYSAYDFHINGNSVSMLFSRYSEQIFLSRVYLTPSLRWSHWNFINTVGSRKFNCFGRTPICDRQRYRQRDIAYTALAKRRAVKNIGG